MRYLKSIVRTLDLAARLTRIAEERPKSQRRAEALRAMLDHDVACGPLGKREPPAAAELAPLPGVLTGQRGGGLAEVG